MSATGGTRAMVTRVFFRSLRRPRALSAGKKAEQQCGRFFLLPEPATTHQKHQNRCFSNSSNRQQQPRDPFRVLGIPRGSSYQKVKETFLKLALEHHPDRQQQKKNNDNDDNKKKTEEFIRIRQAFEVIQEDQNGLAEATEEPQWSEEQLRAFMEEQTSEFLSFRMDHETRQQVIDTVSNLSPGGLDRGGTWLMARMLAEREQGLELENGDDESLPPKQLSARAQSSSSTSVKRRKKR